MLAYREVAHRFGQIKLVPTGLFVVQYDANGAPFNCWKLQNVSISNEPHSDGIYWKKGSGHLVHISGWYNRIQVSGGRYDEAAKLHRQGKLTETHFQGNHHTKLVKQQRDEIIRIIKDKCPNELANFKFKDQFWTTDILRSVIERQYGITYKTEKSYYDLFKAVGFSFHKPSPKEVVFEYKNCQGILFSLRIAYPVLGGVSFTPIQ